MQQTILLVEDDPISQLYLKRSLEKNFDHSLSVHSRGEDAVAYADTERVSVALLDIGLPGIDGIETARRIRRRQDTPIVFVTGNTDPATIREAETVAPYAILSKPVDVEHVCDTITTILQVGQPERLDAIHPGFMLDTLYDTALIGMCITDEERRFVRVNRAYLQTYGYSVEELIGNEFTIVLPEEDRAAAALMHDQFLERSTFEMPAEWRVQRKDGAIRSVYVTAGRMIGTDGRPYKVTTVTDMTDRKENEQHLQTTLREKEMLMKELHHRVKNNLNMLASIVALERDKDTLNEAARETLANVGYRIQALGAVYERLQARDDLSFLDLDDLVRSIVSSVAGSQRDMSVSLDVDMPDNSASVDLGISVGLIVNELLSNSAKYGRQAGISPQVSLSLRQQENTFTIEIADNGPGFPEDFELTQSSGLGIQLLHAISSRHDGVIELLEPARAHLRVTLYDRE